MSLKKATLAAATVVALPLAAQAQPVSGLYIAGGAGVNFKMESDYTVRGGLAPGVNIQADNAGKLRFNDAGWVGLGSIGWGFGNGVRAELEGYYRDNGIRRITAGAANGFGAGGTYHQYGVMANAFYDFVIRSSRFMPYLGVGAGYGWSDLRGVRANFPVNVPVGDAASSIRVRDRDGRFAFQAIAGTAIGLNDVLPGLSLTAEYRFFGTLEPSLRADVSSPAPGFGTRATRFEPTNYNHSLLLGVRYAFNAPRPAAAAVAPTPAPAAAPARTYLVFFDWDRADLTDRARQIIAEAATNARTVRSTRIEVAGHADRSGPDAYNMRLSQRRGDAVAAELVRRGINRNEIVVQAFGETRPLVPTADGVREPQNRRVEIVLR